MKSLPQGATGNLLFGEGGTPQSKHPAAKLNLVSLMDIFTILVFFLMVNTGDVEVLQPDENIVLPKSYATLKPDSVPVVKISNENIQFNNTAISSADIHAKNVQVIDVLLQALQHYEKSSQDEQNKSGTLKAISVMADANVPYSLIKKVLYTSAQAGYVDVALAVEHSSRPVNGVSAES